MTPTESDEIERLKSELAEARNQRDHASVHLAHAIAELTQAEQAIDGIVTDAMAVKIFRRLLYKAVSWIRDVWTMGRYRELKRSFEQLLINAKQSEEREQKWQRLYYSGQRILISKEVDQLKARNDELYLKLAGMTSEFGRIEAELERVFELLNPGQIEAYLASKGVDVEAFRARIRATVAAAQAGNE